MAIKLHLYSFVEDDPSWTMEQAWTYMHSTAVRNFKGVYYENRSDFADFSAQIAQFYKGGAVALNQLITISTLSRSLTTGDYIFIVSRPYLQQMRTEVPTEYYIETDDWYRTILNIPTKSLSSNAMDLLSLNSLQTTLASEISKFAIFNKRKQHETDSELAVELGKIEENMKNWPLVLGDSSPTSEIGTVNLDKLMAVIDKLKKRTSNMIRDLQNNPEILELQHQPQIINPRVLHENMIEISIELNKEGTKSKMLVKNLTHFYFPNAFIHELRSEKILMPKKCDPEVDPDCQPYYPRPIQPHEEFIVKLRSPLMIMEEIQESNNKAGDSRKNFRLLKYRILFNSQVISNTFEVGACKISRHKNNPYKFNLHYSLHKKISANLTVVQCDQNKILDTKKVELSRYSSKSETIGDNIPFDQTVYLAVYSEGKRISSRFFIN